MSETLKRLDCLRIENAGHAVFYGAHQEWYTQEWQRKSGCGPTVCATLLWYLSQTRESLAALCPYANYDKEDFIKLMHEVWHYVTPGRMGVNTTAIFTAGATRYARDKGASLATDVLEVPKTASKRPGIAAVSAFILNAVTNDLPVAYLNLSNGVLTNLDSWHWVTIVAFDAQTMTAEIYDQGTKERIDIRLWLETTALGGGFVVLKPE